MDFGIDIFRAAKILKLALQLRYQFISRDHKKAYQRKKIDLVPLKKCWTYNIDLWWKTLNMNLECSCCFINKKKKTEILSFLVKKLLNSLNSFWNGYIYGFEKSLITSSDLLLLDSETTSVIAAKLDDENTTL